MKQKQEKNTPLPGVWQTVAAGFDTITRHLWVLLLPVLLDLFLWLGPRLSFRPIINQMVALWQQEPSLAPYAEQFLELAPRTNLFTNLSVPFVGVPVMMAGIAPAETPLARLVWEVDQVWLWLLLVVGFGLVGLGLTAVFLTGLALAVESDAAQEAPQFWRRAIGVWLQLLLLALAFIALLFIIFMPLLLLSALLALVSGFLAAVAVLSGAVVVTWLLLALFFVPPALALNDRPLWRAVVESIQLVRQFAWPTLNLLLVVMVGGMVLDWLLLTADDGSWLTFSAILGHAFVTSALVAATFIFYRDRYGRLAATNISQMRPAGAGRMPD